MITIDIPGFKMICCEHLVLDYNGTLAIDGKIKDGVKQALNLLAANVKVHVITADTFGKAKDELKDIKCEFVILNGKNHDRKKANYANNLVNENVIAIGNGRNDVLMLKNAAIGIAVVQKEGAASEALKNSDVICTDIMDALNLLINPKRLVATLRN